MESSFPSAAVVARSAFRAGSLVSFLCRSSVHSRSGLVLVLSFSEPERAFAFARRWAVRLGASVALRRSGWWAGQLDVSVPVAREGVRLPACSGRVVPVRGGLRGFRLALQTSGFAGWRLGRPRPALHA